MRFIVKGPLRENIYNLMRRTGYFFKGENEAKKELAFARPARGYPRFHLFVSVGDDAMTFKLHLDQKKPIYEGAPAHAGEYDSELVQKEAERIKQILQNAKN